MLADSNPLFAVPQDFSVCRANSEAFGLVLRPEVQSGGWFRW